MKNTTENRQKNMISTSKIRESIVKIGIQPLKLGSQPTKLWTKRPSEIEM